VPIVKKIIVITLLCDCCECCQPKVIGMCSVPLKSVLLADALFLESTVEVRDRSRAAADNSSSTSDNSWPLIGHLKVGWSEHDFFVGLNQYWLDSVFLLVGLESNICIY